MAVRRRLILVALSLLAFAGCHAGSGGNLAKTPPPISRETVSATRFITAHNHNAASIQSIQATPSVEVVGRRHAKVGGRLALERPQDFKLQLLMPGTQRVVADIGSNDQGFWFWVDEDKGDKQIFVCAHDQVNASPLAITLQPEWIVEAMGLREFTAEEARTISVKPDGRPGLLLLTQMRKDARGQILTKETVVDEATNEIREHRLWTGAKKELLASAIISTYLTKEIATGPAKGFDSGDDTSPGKTRVMIPSRFRLAWIKEDFKLDVTMDSRTTFNPRFTSDIRAELFTEPTITGARRVDLATLGDPSAANSGRSSSANPPSSRGGGGGIRLGQPQASPGVGVEGAYSQPGSGGGSGRVTTRSTARPPATVAVVGAPIPSGSDVDALRASVLDRPTPALLNR